VEGWQASRSRVEALRGHVGTCGNASFDGNGVWFYPARAWPPTFSFQLPRFSLGCSPKKPRRKASKPWLTAKGYRIPWHQKRPARRAYFTCDGVLDLSTRVWEYAGGRNVRPRRAKSDLSASSTVAKARLESIERWHFRCVSRTWQKS
jgi:hypothetical protein